MKEGANDGGVAAQRSQGAADAGLLTQNRRAIAERASPRWRNGKAAKRRASNTTTSPRMLLGYADVVVFQSIYAGVFRVEVSTGGVECNLALSDTGS